MKIHHIALSVKNLDNSIKFYKEIFGFSEVQRFERKDLGGKAIFLKLNNVSLEIWQFDNQNKNKDDFSDLNVLGIRHLAFEVNNIEEEYTKLKLKKIAISEPRLGASGAKYCFLNDPDGIQLELYESK
jgi:glyoxylase I family protein